MLALTAAAVPGDATLTGRVDLEDLLVLAQNWGQSGKNWLGGDFTGDGLVNEAHLTLLAQHWQSGVGSTAASLSEAMGMFSVFDGVAIPEPASGGAVLGAGLLLARRRTRQ
jgi:hypothetical protein